MAPKAPACSSSFPIVVYSQPSSQKGPAERLSDQYNPPCPSPTGFPHAEGRKQTPHLARRVPRPASRVSSVVTLSLSLTLFSHPGPFASAPAWLACPHLGMGALAVSSAWEYPRGPLPRIRYMSLFKCHLLRRQALTTWLKPSSNIQFSFFAFIFPTFLITF